ncbi:MAG: ABC transporter substrate-binding protein [Acidiferrobacterales bacterium]|nr:ABC transporter substrate-binding protein [Acidiferrobacterales bacterium]
MRCSNTVARIIGCMAVMLMLLVPPAISAKEKVVVSIISVSVYGGWYIVNEKGFADNIEVDVQIIEDITARNAGLSSGDIHCIMTTMDSTVVTAAAEVPVRHVAVPLMSYGLDQMIAVADVKTDADLNGRTYAADYGFLNHMWMLLTLKRAGLAYDAARHSIMLPQDAAAAFVSGNLDVDVNFVPFTEQSLQLEGSHVLKTSLTDKTWERGLISDSIACSQNFLDESPQVAKELIRAWFEAIDWWKQNPDEGNAIVAKGLDWPEADVRLTQAGALMLNLNQNLGALGIGDGQPVCSSLPEGVEQPPAEDSGWGALVGSDSDCEAGYLESTWDLFNEIYQEAQVIDSTISFADGTDSSIIEALYAAGVHSDLNSNLWIGRLEP